MKTIDLRPGELECVLRTLARHVPEREVWAFGSRTSGTATEFSDLDLAVLGDAPIPDAVLADLREAFRESDLPFKVDVIDWATTQDYFRRIVERRARRAAWRPWKPPDGNSPMTSGGPASRRTLKLTLAYDGTAYAGWQVQPRQATVQETLEDAIAKVTGQRVRVLASGRTDAGVHALGQVVGFHTDSALPPEALRRALNANLPQDVAVLEVAEAPADFHAISHVRRKCYRYLIHNGPARDVFCRHFVWHYIHGRLDAEAMQRAALALLGTHDFSSFETAGAPGRQRADRFSAPRGAGQGRGRSRFSSHENGDCPLLGPPTPIPPISSSSRSPPTVFSITWCGRSWARWSRWAAAPGRRHGPARCCGPRTAALPAPPRRRRGCAWSRWNTEPLVGWAAQCAVCHCFAEAVPNQAVGSVPATGFSSRPQARG